MSGLAEQDSFGGGLFEQHAELLRASAVSPAVARERGYVWVCNGNGVTARSSVLGLAWPEER